MSEHTIVVYEEYFQLWEDASVKATPPNSDARLLAEFKRWLRRRDWLSVIRRAA